MDSAAKTLCVDLSVGFLHEMADAEKTDLDREILEQAKKGDAFHLSCEELKKLPKKALEKSGEVFDKWTSVATYLKRRETLYRLGIKWPSQDPSDKAFSNFLYLRLPTEETPLQRKAIAHGALTCAFERVCSWGRCHPFVLTNAAGEVEESVADIWMEAQNEPDPLVRRQALWSLGGITSQIDRPKIVETLLARVDPKKESDDSVRAVAIAALSRVNLEALEQPLIPDTLKNYLNPKREKNPFIRKGVATALGKLALKKFTVTLLAYLAQSQDPSKEPDPKVREAVVMAVGEVARQPGNRHYQDWLEKSRDPKWEPAVRVRWAAHEAITALVGEEDVGVPLVARLLDFYRNGEDTDDFWEETVRLLTKLGKAKIPPEELKKFEERKSGKKKTDKESLLAEFAFSLGYLMERLPEVGLQKVLLEILENKTEPIPFARSESLRALAKFGKRDAAFFKALIQSLDPRREHSEDVRALAAESLLLFANPQNALPLARLLQNSLRVKYEKSRAVAWAAMNTLAKVAGLKELPNNTKKELAEIFWNIVEGRKQFEVEHRVSSLSLLTTLKDQAPHLQALLLKLIQPEFELKVDVRLEAMEQLATLASELDAKEAIPILLARLDEKNEPEPEITIAAMEVLKGMGERAAMEKQVIEKLETIAHKKEIFGLSRDDLGLMEDHAEKKMAAWDALEVLQSHLFANVPPPDEAAVLQSDAFRKLEIGLSLLVQYRENGNIPPEGLVEDIRKLRDENGFIGRALNESTRERFRRAKERYALHVLDLPWFDEENRRLGVQEEIVDHQMEVLATGYEPSLADVGILSLEILKEETSRRVVENREEDRPLWVKIPIFQR